VKDPTSGFWSAWSSSFVVTVNPETVVVTSVSPLGPTQPTARVTGTGTAGYTVKIYDGSTFLGSGLIASDGTWSVDVNVASGNRALNAKQTSTTGFTSEASTPVPVAVPDAPTIAPTPDNVFTATPVAIGGQGIAGTTLKRYDGGVEVGTVIVGPSGTWTATLSFATAGTHTLTARQRDPLTGYWSPSAAFTIAAFVDRGPPAITAVSTRRSPGAAGGSRSRAPARRARRSRSTTARMRSRPLRSPRTARGARRCRSGSARTR
jgi:hypothetical protein